MAVQLRLFFNLSLRNTKALNRIARRVAREGFSPERPRNQVPKAGTKFPRIQGLFYLRGRTKTH